MTRARGTIKPGEVGDEQRVRELAEESRRFLSMLSGPAPSEPIERARCLAHACASLYAAASQIGEIDLDEDEAIDELPETSLEVKVAIEWTQLGPAPSYQLLVDPFVDREPAAASLEDDLEEIIAEVAAGLVIHDDADERWRAAASEWRMDFAAGWGRHLAAVQYAAHCALVAHADAGPDPAEPT